MGQVEEAAATLEEAIDSGVASSHTLALAHALGWAVVAHVEGGRPDRARRLVQQIDAYLVAHAGMNTYYGAAMPHIARGVVHHHDGRLAEADHELARGSSSPAAGPPGSRSSTGWSPVPGSPQASVIHDAATGMLADARRALTALQDPGRLADLVTRAERAARPASDAGEPPLVEVLSDRELAVLRLLQTDLSQREIAARLFVSFNTVKTHMRSIFRNRRLDPDRSRPTGPGARSDLGTCAPAATRAAWAHDLPEHLALHRRRLGRRSRRAHDPGPQPGDRAGDRSVAHAAGADLDRALAAAQRGLRGLARLHPRQARQDHAPGRRS